MNIHQRLNYVSVSVSRGSQQPYKVILSSFPFYRWGYWAMTSYLLVIPSKCCDQDLNPGRPGSRVPLLKYCPTFIFKEALQIWPQKDWDDFTVVALRLSLDRWLSGEIDTEGKDSFCGREWHAWSKRRI